MLPCHGGRSRPTRGPRRSPAGAGLPHEATAATRTPIASGLVCAAILAAGCSGPPVQELPRWQLSSVQLADIPVEVPRNLGDLLGPPGGHYSLTAAVELPAHWRGEPVTLSTPMFAGIATLQADDETVEPLERPLFDGYWSTRSQSWRIPAAATRDGVVHLSLRVDHAFAPSAWMHTAPRLARGPYPDGYTRFVDAWHLATGGGALLLLSAMTLGYLALFAAARRRTEFGWLALQLATAAVYIACILGLLQPVLGRWEWPVTATSLAAAIVTSIHAMRAQYALPTPGRWWDALILATAIVSPACILWPELFRLVILWIVIVLSAGTLEHGACLARAWRREPHHPTLRSNIIGFGVFAIAAPVDFLVWLGFEPFHGVRTASVGLAVYSLMQFAALMRSHLASMQATAQLNDELRASMGELQQRHAQIGHLNDELRHHLRERSRQLSDSLARLAGSTQSVRPLEADEIIDDRYRVVRTIGAGAMGAVYEVSRVGDGARLAMKVLQNLSTARELARFAREAHLIAEIVHPNVVEVFDVAVARSGIMYIVMEYVEGASLRELDERYRDVPWCLEVIAQLAGGLAAVHDRGIVHRDLKPANVLVENPGGALRIKLGDFGISGASAQVLVTSSADAHEAPAEAELTAELRPLAGPAAGGTEPQNAVRTAETTPPSGPSGGEREGPDVAALTRSGILLGTPAYMAPELASASRATSAADVFSLGVLAHEILRGHRPFAVPPVFARLRQAPTTPPALLDEVEGLPAEVADVLERALSFEPARRPTADEIHQTVRRCCSPATSRPADSAGRA